MGSARETMKAPLMANLLADTEASSASADLDLTRAADPGGYRIVPAKHPWRIAGSVVAVLLIAITVHSVFTNERWGWLVFAQYFFDPAVLVGLGRTLWLTLLA